MYVGMCGHVKVKEQPGGVGSVLLPCGLLGMVASAFSRLSCHTGSRRRVVVVVMICTGDQMRVLAHTAKRPYTGPHATLSVSIFSDTIFPEI